MAEHKPFQRPTNKATACDKAFVWRDEQIKKTLAL